MRNENYSMLASTLLKRSYSDLASRKVAIQRGGRNDPANPLGR